MPREYKRVLAEQAQKQAKQGESKTILTGVSVQVSTEGAPAH